MFSSANNLIFAFIILLIVKGGNGNPALFANSGTNTVADQRELPNEILLEMDMDTVDMARYRGYRAERHHVVTTDGYILELHRMGKDGQPGRKPAVLLQHGLFDTSFSWVNNMPGQSLGYVLADAGFDVWMGNVRGNNYSRAHQTLNPDTDRAYWQFSFDQYAKLDMPAMLQHIERTTGNSKVFYVGHSQGTSMAFAALSKHAEVYNRIKYYVALAPVVSIANTNSLVMHLLAPHAEELLALADLAGTGELLRYSKLVNEIIKLECDNVRVRAVECSDFVNSMAAYTPEHMNKTRVPIIMAHVPGGTSIRGVVHFAQMIVSGIFRMFDYGTDKNLEVYGQSTPPQYHPRDIRVPVTLFWSDKDSLTQEDDFGWLEDELRSGGSLREVHHMDGYAHRDFIWSVQARKQIYDRIVQLFKAEL
jgi:pimeloyl-ACP methyl ester carboxylesterase